MAINLHRMRLDRQGMIWVSSRGDYRGNGSSTHVIDPVSDAVIESYPIANSNMAICGDSVVGRLSVPCLFAVVFVV